MKYIAFLSLSLLFPLLAAAEAIPAGFPEGAVWLSKLSPTAGETVHVYAPIYNSSDTDIQGNVIFAVDAATVATVSFSLDAGETKITSADWKALEGEHTVTVSVENARTKASQEPVTLQKGSGGQVSVTVAPAPPTKLEEAIEAAHDYIDSASPAAGSFIDSLSEGTEGLRESGIAYLKEKTESPAASKGQVLGAFTENPSLQTAAAGSSGIWQGFLKVLLYIFEWRILFYLLLLFVLYLMWKLIRVFLKDRKDRI